MTRVSGFSYTRQKTGNDKVVYDLMKWSWLSVFGQVFVYGVGFGDISKKIKFVK